MLKTVILIGRQIDSSTAKLGISLGRLDEWHLKVFKRSQYKNSKLYVFVLPMCLYLFGFILRLEDGHFVHISYRSLFFISKLISKARICEFSIVYRYLKEKSLSFHVLEMH